MNLKATGKLLLSTLTVFAALVGCSKEQLQELERFAIIEEEKATVRVNFCTIDANAVKSNLKFIFVMDKSGSNQDLPDELGTDKNGYRRYTQLLMFLKDAASDPSVFYSLVNFSTNANVVSGFTNDRAKFTTTVTKESNPSNLNPPRPTDGGWTNYLAAFQQVNSLISADITAAKTQPEVVSSYYVVVFITDGAPYIGTNQLQAKTDILNAIKGLKSFEAQREWVESVQVQTGFYYNDVADATARDLLKDMALTGSGEFYEFAAGQVIDFNQFAVPVRKVKHTLRDVFVANMNTVWWNGQRLVDSDADQLPDENEVILGSDPYDADSDANGVSDGIEYFLNTRPCKDSKCSAALAEPYLNCATYKRSNLPNGQKYGDQDKDFINDCEEAVILKSKIDSFDSNDDWIPDDLAFRFGISFVQGRSEIFLDPDNDNLNTYGEIKVQTPVRYANDRIFGLNPYEYDLQMVSSDLVKDCYQLDVLNVSRSTGENRIRVYLLENTSVIDDKRFMRVSEKSMAGGFVEFDRGDFQ